MRLACGCIRGKYLCPKVVQLWKETERAYEEAKITGNWIKYEETRKKYYKHFGEKPVVFK